MKKTLLFLMAALALAACSKKENTNSRTADLEKAPTTEAKGLIAYVEIDSIMSQYEFCKENRTLLEQHYKNYQQQLAAKESALENAAASFQKKLQASQYTSQEAAQAEQNRLMGEQQKLEKLSAELTEKYAKEEEAAGKALRDSVQRFLKDYNRTAATVSSFPRAETTSSTPSPSATSRTTSSADLTSATRAPQRSSLYHPTPS